MPSLPTSQKTYVWLSTPGTENLLLHGKFCCYSPCHLHLFLLTDHCFFWGGLCFVSISKLPNLSQKSNVPERLQYYKESRPFRNTLLTVNASKPIKNNSSDEVQERRVIENLLKHNCKIYPVSCVNHFNPFSDYTFCTYRIFNIRSTDKN